LFPHYLHEKLKTHATGLKPGSFILAMMVCQMNNHIFIFMFRVLLGMLTIVTFLPAIPFLIIWKVINFLDEREYEK